MQLFFSENQPDYSTYTFNYAIYCVKESQTELPEIYNKGFLPYTGNVTINADIFYLARSLRVNLKEFKDSSENRRINRKIEPLNIHLSVMPKKTEFIQSPAFSSFCMNYAAKRFSGNAMTLERFNYIMGRETGSHILTFQSNDKVVGYVYAAIEQDILHYWFAFFDQTYMKDYMLGKWMMWKTISWAKENNLSHVYLGTCYGKHSLYKVRDHNGLAFFDGSKWNTDMNVLKQLCKTDADQINKDRFKLLDNQNAFLENLT